MFHCGVLSRAALLALIFGLLPPLAISQTVVPTSYRQFGQPGGPGGYFDTPVSVAVSPSYGFVYVSDSNHDQIQVFDQDGNFRFRWGANGSGDSEFQSPRGLSIGQNGEVYVADKNNHRVQKFDYYGRFLGTYGGFGAGPGQFNAPRDLSCYDGQVFVLDTGNNRVQVFDSQGAFVREWGTSGSGSGQFSLPLGIDVESGKVFVADSGNNRIQCFSTNGDYLNSWSSSNPWGLEVDYSGYVFVTEKESSRIFKYSWTGELLATWGEPGSGTAEYQTPADIASYWDWYHGGRTFYVVDCGNHRIQRVNESGVLIQAWGQFGSGQGLLRDPAGLAVDAAGNLLVADGGNSRIQKFARDGTYLMSWGTPGSGPGQFSRPSSIAVSRLNEVYVSDSSNRRVQKFNSDGVFLAELADPGLYPGQPWSPGHLAIEDSGSVYVIDEANRQICRFTGNGSFVAHWGVTQYGSPAWPVAMAVDADRLLNVLVTNGNGYCTLQTFTYYGALVRRDQSPQYYSTDVAIDNAGYRYLLADQGYGIAKLRDTGEQMAYWSANPSGYSRGAGIVVDGSGRVFVSDPNNGRISVHSWVNTLGIYADSGGEDRALLAPLHVPTTLHLIAMTGGASASGVSKVEFRVEVSDQAGYMFNYTAPSGAMASGSPFDLTPQDPNDAAGTTLIFPSCRPATLPRAEGDRVDCGTISVINLGGGPTELRIRKKIPSGMPSGSGPVFYLCDYPLQSPTGMYSTDNGDVYFRAVLNRESQPLPEPAPFETELVEMDMRDLSVGRQMKVLESRQVLDERLEYLITVEGTFSLWPASAWSPAPIVVCGTPEYSPQYPSSGGANGWVGADAEAVFAVPLPPGGDCDSLQALGYELHQSRLGINLGGEAIHIEPLGGRPQGASPGHRYFYRVRGQNRVVQFSWLQDQVNQAYGVLRISISSLDPTGVASSALPLRSVILSAAPNPFNATTTIRFHVSEPGAVDFDIYNAHGRLIRNLLHEPQTIGEHTLKWNGLSNSGKAVPSGAYFLVMRTAQGVSSRKVIMVK